MGKIAASEIEVYGAEFRGGAGQVVDNEDFVRKEDGYVLQAEVM